MQKTTVIALRNHSGKRNDSIDHPQKRSAKCQVRSSNKKAEKGKSLRASKTKLATLAQKALAQWTVTYPIKYKKNAPFQLVDFFCGAGGMSAGFAALAKVKPSFELLGGCDINNDAVRTYSHNYGTAGIQEDILHLSENESALQRFISKLNGYDPRKPLVVIGCAPCQGFTSHRKRRWREDDERNTLVGAFASVAIRLNAACIVMENVPEMLSSKYWNYFLAAREKLSEAGYIIHQTVYNAASFGVPQERFRSLVVAMRKDFTLPEPMVSENSFMTVRDAIGHLPAVKPGASHPDDKFHRSAKHRKSTIVTIRAVPKNGGSRPAGVGPKCLDKVRGFYDVYGRLYWDKPAITLTHYARNPASGRFVHPVQNRGLTIREAALLQSFPVGFEFVGNFDSIFKQIGEAVPPKFACAVAASVFVEMSSLAPSKEELENAIPSITEPISSSFSSVIAGIKIRRQSA